MLGPNSRKKVSNFRSNPLHCLSFSIETTKRRHALVLETRPVRMISWEMRSWHELTSNRNHKKKKIVKRRDLCSHSHVEFSHFLSGEENFVRRLMSKALARLLAPIPTISALPTYSFVAASVKRFHSCSTCLAGVAARSAIELALSPPRKAQKPPYSSLQTVTKSFEGWTN